MRAPPQGTKPTGQCGPRAHPQAPSVNQEAGRRAQAPLSLVLLGRRRNARGNSALVQRSWFNLDFLILFKFHLGSGLQSTFCPVFWAGVGTSSGRGHTPSPRCGAWDPLSPEALTQHCDHHVDHEARVFFPPLPRRSGLNRTTKMDFVIPSTY